MDAPSATESLVRLQASLHTPPQPPAGERRLAPQGARAGPGRPRACRGCRPHCCGTGAARRASPRPRGSCGSRPGQNDLVDPGFLASALTPPPAQGLLRGPAVAWNSTRRPYSLSRPPSAGQVLAPGSDQLPSLKWPGRSPASPADSGLCRLRPAWTSSTAFQRRLLGGLRQP